MKVKTMNRNFLSALLLLFATLDFSGSQRAVADQATQPTAATRINPKDGAEMVLVPAGPFKMGVDPMPTDVEHRKQVNTPKHEVALDAYWIYKYPVTVRQYKKFIAETSGMNLGWGVSGKMPPEPLWGWKDDHPMVNVNWWEAVAYARWAGAALPTEAQWEKAARGTDERLYPWGNEWDPKRCVHSDKVWGDIESTRPVGSCPDGASPYGAMDMAGNVWQWCSDFYNDHYYRTSPASNPTGPAQQTTVRSVRGGAWPLCKPKCFRTVNRDWCRVPELWSMDAGFRCVVTGSNPQLSAQTPPPIPAPVATPAPAIASAATTGAQPVMPTPGGQAKAGEQQYLYALDATGGTIFKINLADPEYKVEVLGSAGANVSLDFDSKGNIYAAGGTISKRTPDGKTKPFLTGLRMGFACVIDSKDNLYFADYQKKNCRTWKIPLNKVTDDMLPITVTYKDEDQEQDPDIKPAGLLIQVHNLKGNPYGLSCDAYDNVYMTRLSSDFPSFYRFTPEGKVSEGGWGSNWPRQVIINADGSFTALGGPIMKVSKGGLRIGMFAPDIDFHHSTSISFDDHGILYQATPPAKAEKVTDWNDPNPKDPEFRSHVYKYTPDGERSEIARMGRNLWFSMVYPKTKYPTTKPAE
jgi:formylglycine-generating enzyme required for sulfatase activity